jgi:hypothetical protein
MGGMDASIYKLGERVLREADPNFYLDNKKLGGPSLK